MGKSKKVKSEPKEEPDVDMDETTATKDGDKSGLELPSCEKEDYEALMEYVNPIAQPMAPRKTAKKVYKLIKKSSKVKHHLRQGIVDVQRALRKNETGIVVLAGDVNPVDIYAHIAGMCEEANLPYCYTPSKQHLGLACGHRRPSIMCLIREHGDYKELYEELHKSIDVLPIPR
jgi:H/ACA ribonucleoprotein complex subunit 2